MEAEPLMVVTKEVEMQNMEEIGSGMATDGQGLTKTKFRSSMQRGHKTLKELETGKTRLG